VPDRAARLGVRMMACSLASTSLRGVKRRSNPGVCGLLMFLWIASLALAMTNRNVV
jgi:hypothetical protein